MAITFLRPIGAAADLKELEYVSVLHQTARKKIRQDGSIYAVDVAHFLCSRYGIKITEEDVRNTILKGFGGGDEDEECIDLVELVAILMIPLLLKASKQSKKKKRDDFESEYEYQDYLERRAISESLAPPAEIIKDVISMILKDVTGSCTPVKLTKDLVKDILIAYGEKELAADDKIVKDMFLAAGGGSHDALLDHKAFARALTQDVQDYDIENETKLTCNYFDVFETNDLRDLNKKKESLNEDVESQDRILPPKAIFTAPSIDFVSGTYSSKSLVVFLWTSFIMTYFAYFYEYQNAQEQNYCSHERNSAFGCLVANGITNWLVSLVQLSILGLIYMGLGSLGNSLKSYSQFWLVIGFVSVLIFTVVPHHLSGTKREEITNDTTVESNTISIKMEDAANFFRIVGGDAASYDHLVFYMAMILSCLAMLVQLYLLIGFYVTRKSSIERKKIEKFFTPGTVIADSTLTQTAAYKMNQVIKIIGFYFMTKLYIERQKIEKFFTPGTVKTESKLKQAAAYKMNQMVKNAYDIHTSSLSSNKTGTSYGKALLDFAKLGKKFQPAGGFYWTWKRIVSGELFSREGTWFSGRLLAGNLSQLLISVFILIYGISYTHKLRNTYGTDAHEKAFTEKAMKLTGNILLSVDELTLNTINSVNGVIQTSYEGYNCSDRLANFNCNLVAGVWECSDSTSVCAMLDYGLDHSMLINSPVKDALEEALEAAVVSSVEKAMSATIDRFYPEEKWMVVIPMQIATGVAFLVAIYLALVYIPSVVSTTLQLRSGVIPSLNDKKFYRFKKNQDQTTVLLGSMFWGTLFAGAGIGGFIGGTVFLFMWPVTRSTSLHYLGQFIGLLVTMELEAIIYKVFNGGLYASFYRRMPMSANLTTLILECCNIGLSAGFVIFRAFKLLFASMMYVGRIDTPILCPGVGRIRDYDLDAYPNVFLKDILSYEAHRHPYMETLGFMYMMKLRYGQNFAKTCGSCWRILFVFALMPWLRKYRVMARPALGDIDDNEISKYEAEYDTATMFTRSSALSMYQHINKEWRKSNEDSDDSFQSKRKQNLSAS